MSSPFLGQIALFPYNFAPLGWAMCQGQLLSISQNTALFSLLGTQFGGNGTSNFALPDLRGRVPIGQGQGPGLSVYDMGSQQGQESVTLTTATVPAHSHAFPAFASAATTSAPNGALPAEGHGAGRGGLSFAVNTYSASGSAASLAAGQVAPVTSGGAPHNNLQPYLTLNWCIAMQGIFPSRS
jgi:microcystin-dependent protein